MMDEVLVNMAIDLGYQIQGDARYTAVREAQRAADADEELQKLIGEFNIKRMNINQEEAKPEAEQDTAHLRQLNEEMRTVYAQIMANEHMRDYNTAHSAFDELVRKINAAIALAAQGQDPALAAQESGCTGNCGSCGGCGGH